MNLWQDDLRLVVGTPGKELKRYRAVYEKDFEGRWAVSGVPELVEAVTQSDIVFCGDYHTLPAAQRLPIRLLRRLVGSRRKLTLALEMLYTEDQEIVNDFLAGRITENRLRRRIAFDRRWGFDWFQYYPLLEFARRHRIGVVGINTDPGAVRDRLKRRDRHAADVLAARLRSRADELLCVVAGDWHVARGHLPRRVLAAAERAGLRPGSLIVHQNHDGLYRRFHEADHKPVDVVRRGGRMYCVFNATPLIKTASCVHWAWRQELLESETIEDGADPMILDPATTFHEIHEALADHFGIRADNNASDGSRSSLNVLCQEDSGRIDGLARSIGAGPERRRAWRKKLESGRPVYIPELSTLFLGEASLHHVVEEAARRLRGSGDADVGADAEERFYSWLFDESAAFLASRLINPRRKCDLVRDLLARDSSSKAARFEADWCRRLVRPGRRGASLNAGHAFWKSAWRVRRRVARTIGRTWGFHLYEAYTAGHIKDDWLRVLFSPRRPQGGRSFFEDGCRAVGPLPQWSKDEHL